MMQLIKIKKSQFTILGTMLLVFFLIFTVFHRPSLRAIAQPSPEILQRLDASQPAELGSTDNEALKQLIIEEPENDLLHFQQGLNDYQQAKRLRQNNQDQEADALFNQAIAKILRAIELDPESWMYWFRQQVREPSLRNAKQLLRSGRELCKSGGRQRDTQGKIPDRLLFQAFQDFRFVENITRSERSRCKAEASLYRRDCRETRQSSFRNCTSQCLGESSSDACIKMSNRMVKGF